MILNQFESESCMNPMILTFGALLLKPRRHTYRKIGSPIDVGEYEE